MRVVLSRNGEASAFETPRNLEPASMFDLNKANFGKNLQKHDIKIRGPANPAAWWDQQVSTPMPPDFR